MTVDIRPLQPNYPFIQIIQSNLPQSPDAWLLENKHIVDELIQEHGGVLLRGFQAHSISNFSKCAEILVPQLQEYMFRSTPRTVIGKKIYTSTIYPQDRSIALHNEFSYFNQWPHYILFYCSVPATSRGETPVANCTEVLKHIPSAIVEKFDAHKVMYVRHYHEGIDLSWQEVFQTHQREKVQSYCEANHISYEWYNHQNNLKTWHIAQATCMHSISKQKVWFNQAHLFHLSNLEEAAQALLIDTFGKEEVPRNSFYGNGEDIAPEDLTIIREAYEKEKVMFAWERGDILVLDNTLLAHGREPYEGERRIATAMG